MQAYTFEDLQSFDFSINPLLYLREENNGYYSLIPPNMIKDFTIMNPTTHQIYQLLIEDKNIEEIKNILLSIYDIKSEAELEADIALTINKLIDLNIIHLNYRYQSVNIGAGFKLVKLSPNEIGCCYNLSISNKDNIVLRSPIEKVDFNNLLYLRETLFSRSYAFYIVNKNDSAIGYLVLKYSEPGRKSMNLISCSVPRFELCQIFKSIFRINDINNVLFNTDTDNFKLLQSNFKIPLNKLILNNELNKSDVIISCISRDDFDE